jgi:sterol desaturase/sphingolipid hydroxylase (fatty acid hydroxylase superfamily)
MSMIEAAVSALSVTATFAAGAMLWSFSEYGLHNWVGHLGKGKSAFSREHLHHHAEAHYFAPTSHKVISAVAVLSLMTPLAVLALGARHGVTFSVGFVVGYTTYEVLHRRMHTHAPANAWGRWARKHHFYHHFSSPKANHGVTSPLWDIVFRTHAPVTAPVRVPRKLAMPWLIDPATGDLKEALRADYVLVGRAKRGHQGAADPDTAPAQDLATA